MKKLDRKMLEHCPKCAEKGILSALRPCRECYGTGIVKVRCAQCWTWKPVSEFLGKKVAVKKNCDECSSRMTRWAMMDLSEREKATSPRASIPSDGTELYVKFVLVSANRKTGPIPVTMTSANSCPKSCAFYGRGCYAEAHILAIHWRRVSNGEGLSWPNFLRCIYDLPEGQLWRHNEAGDLPSPPGDGEKIDFNRLKQLLNANHGKRGFTYTHKKHFEMIRFANESGFAVNLSCDTLAQCDEYAKERVPMTVVLPYDAPDKGNRTPGGLPVVVCPAQLRDSVTCKSCELCAVSTRKSIVGFKAHGDRKKQITERMSEQLRLPLFQGAP